jgi:hypothetical protein
MSWVLLVLALAGPELHFEDCPESLLDVRQVRAQLSMRKGLPEGGVEVRCLGSTRVELRSGARRREVTLSGSTAAQRERTLSLLVAEWLTAPPQEPPPVQRDAGLLVDAGLWGMDAGLPEVEDAGPPPMPPDAGFLFIIEQPVAVPAPPPPAPIVTDVPVELGLVPGVGFNRLFPRPSRNFLAIGLIGVSSDLLDGVSLAPVSMVDGRLRGVQLGAATLAGPVQGAQLSAAFAWSRGPMAGLQVGAVTLAGDVTGAQLGLVNIAGDLTGVQLGVVNIARSVRGTQVGFLNISSDGPAPLGVLNVTEDSPFHLALTVGDTNLLNVALKTGGTRLYTVLSMGWVPRTFFRGGGGVGLRLGTSKQVGWYGEVEWLTHAVLNLDSIGDGLVVTTSLGLNVGYRLAPRLAIFLGPQFSLLFGNDRFPGKAVSLFGIATPTPGFGVAPGLQFGIEL